MQILKFEPEFKKVLNNIEILGVHAIVEKLYENDKIDEEIEELLYVDVQEPYARLHVSDAHASVVEIDGKDYYVDFFAITENGLLVMICQDDELLEDEEEPKRYYIEVEADDWL